MKSCLAAIMIASFAALGSAPAWADADEASVHAGAVVGAAMVGTPALGPVEVVPTAGMSGRFTYAISDWYAFETAVAVEHSASTASFDGPPLVMPPGSGHEPEDRELLVRRMGWFRGEVGFSARLGVRWIPIVHVGVGVQMQLVGAVREVAQNHTLPGPDSDIAAGVTGVMGVGLDYRFDERWVLGASVRARRAFFGSFGDSYSSLGVAMHVGYYWYPGNMAR